MHPISVKAPRYIWLVLISLVYRDNIMEEAKNILMNGGWLNDKVIYAGMHGMQLLKPTLSPMSITT